MTETEKLAYQSHIIMQILEAPFEEAIEIYAENFNYVQEYSFIFPHPEGDNYVRKFREFNLNNLDVIHFFGSETLYCLNAHSFTSIMLGEDYELKIASLVSLDTQIQSYLYRNYIDNKNKIPENITEIQKIINSRRCMVDGFAYMFENLLFNPEYLKSKIYKDNTFAFETYFFKDRDNAESYSKEILELDNHLLNDEFSNWYRRQYLLYYLALLVMTDININHKNLSLYQKELSFVKYFHEQIGILSDRETNLAKLFFNYGTNIKFFGKIQKGRKDTIKNLKNMAWDIFHLHNTFNNLSIIPEKADFLIPFFITYDQRLKDIAPIYKLKSAAFIKNGFHKHLNFLTDLIDPIIRHEYFTAQAYLKRQEKLKGVTEESIIIKAQSEIEKYEKLLG